MADIASRIKAAIAAKQKQGVNEFSDAKAPAFVRGPKDDAGNSIKPPKPGKKPAPKKLKKLPPKVKAQF